MGEGDKTIFNHNILWAIISVIGQIFLKYNRVFGMHSYLHGYLRLSKC